MAPLYLNAYPRQKTWKCEEGKGQDPGLASVHFAKKSGNLNACAHLKQIRGMCILHSGINVEVQNGKKKAVISSREWKRFNVHLFKQMDVCK